MSIEERSTEELQEILGYNRLDPMFRTKIRRILRQRKDQIMDGLPNTGDSVADAIELGKGLMRGNRESLQLGYDWRNATIAVLERYPIEDREDKLRVTVALRGFAAGLNATEEDDFHRVYADAFSQGHKEAIARAVNPAPIHDPA